MILQRANSWPLKLTPNDCKKYPSQVLAAGLCCIAAPDLRILLEFEQACSRRAPVSIQSLNGPRATGDDPSDSGSDSSDDSSSNSRRQSHKTKWFLGDVQVCRRAFAKMLGIGQSRLQRTRHTFQGLDERTLPGQWMW